LHRNLVGNLDMPRDYTSNLGSARVSRVGERVLTIANFPYEFLSPIANEIAGGAQV